MTTAFKFLDSIDDHNYHPTSPDNYQALTANLSYKLDTWTDVPGNGSYCSTKGKNIDSWGVGNTLAAFEVENQNINAETPSGVKCFRRVKLVATGWTECISRGLIPGKCLNGLLVWAAGASNTTAISYLLSSGADVHAWSDMALRWAAERDNLDAVEVLLDAEADIHAVNDEALTMAATRGNFATCEVLLSNGANLHAWDEWALRKAAEAGNLTAVQLFVFAGADPHILNNQAIQRARDNGHDDIADWLESQ